MKTSLLIFISLTYYIVINVALDKNVERIFKRSIFDMIKKNKKDMKINEQSTKLGMVLTHRSAFEYENLRNIILRIKRNDPAQKKRKNKRRLKAHFLAKESEKLKKSKEKRSKHQHNLIIKLSFIIEKT